MKSALRKLARSFLYTQNTVRYRVEFARLAEAFRLIGRQGSVLDGGAGSGEMLRKAHAAGFCLEGHALEPEHFAILQQNYRNISGLRCTQGGLLAIPFAAESFDCAMSTQVLEHIEDHEKAASELARVVKPGDHLTLGTFTVDVRSSRHTDIAGISQPMSGVIPPDAGSLWFWQ